MKRFKRRTDRPDPARRRPGADLEALEARQLMTRSTGLPAYSVPYYQPSTLIPNTIDHSTPKLLVAHPIGTASPQQLARLEGQGKLLTGKDRQGNEWQIEVHGPGSVIVTDATPNDAVFNDDIDTIQLVGTSLTDTYVTGQVSASARVTTGGTVVFNHLLSQGGVKSIILNGFTLARTVAISPTGVPEIFLPGGVQFLSFNNIEAAIDTSTNVPPFNIIIGDPSTPLAVAPVIKLHSIQNTVFNSTINQPANGVPQTTPSVNLVVNGHLRGLDIVSAGEAPILPAAQLYNFPTVSSTGRTSIQARRVGHLKVAGSATNFTVSRSPQPFQNGFSGVNHITTAEFGGTADAVGLDAKGPIKHVRFLRGVGNPAGSGLAATSLGLPDPQRGYPSFGLSGGTVNASHIGRLTVGAADLIRQTPQDPDIIQYRRQGSTLYFTRPGNAATNAAIVSSGSIGRTTIVGNLQTSEVRSGFSYSSYIAGLEPVRSPSSIGRVRMRGDVVDSVIAASYRPVDRVFGNGNDIAAKGKITGNLTGNLASAGQATALGDAGTGFFAQKKVGYLPPPSRPRTVNGVLLPQQSPRTTNILLRP